MPAPHRVVALASLLALSSVSYAQSDWEQFRGPTGEGYADAAPLRWSDEEGVVWKADVPGRGWSSPVVRGDVVWLTTAVETPNLWAQDAAKSAEPSASEGGALESVELLAVAVDRASGAVLKTVSLFTIDDPPAVHALNSYASPTPVLTDTRLCCGFGRFGVAGVDTQTGQVAWRQEFEFAQSVGAGSSLVLHKGANGEPDVLIVVCDGLEKQFVVGLNAETGDRLWKTDRPPIVAANPEMRKSFCTPLLVDNHGRMEAIIPTAQWLCSYDPQSGRELWRHAIGDGFSIVPRPVHRDGVVYFSTGFSPPSMIAFRLPTLEEAPGAGEPVELGEANVVWREQQQAPTQASPLLTEQQLITVSDAGIAIGRDYQTGKSAWRTRIGSTCSASPIATPEHVYLFNRDGLTTVLPNATLSGRPTVLSENQLDGVLMATPAVVEGELYLRTTSGLYRINGA